MSSVDSRDSRVALLILDDPDTFHLVLETLQREGIEHGFVDLTSTQTQIEKNRIKLSIFDALNPVRLLELARAVVMRDSLDSQVLVLHAPLAIFSNAVILRIFLDILKQFSALVIITTSFDKQASRRSLLAHVESRTIELLERLNSKLRIVRVSLVYTEPYTNPEITKLREDSIEASFRARLLEVVYTHSSIKVRKLDSKDYALFRDLIRHILKVKSKSGSKNSPGFKYITLKS